MDTSIDASKKVPLEELTQVELIKKYRGLLIILQKAKQSKESLLEENNSLKMNLTLHTTTSNELVENLTQQKLELITTLDAAKIQNETLNNKLQDFRASLNIAENKISDLDTISLGYRRQVDRLTEDNEQLLTQLDTLEKHIEELKQIGLQQQEQLLTLEHNNKSNEIDVLQKELDELKKECKDSESLMLELKAKIEEKDKQNENYLSTADDLNIELHKNKAMVEKLQRDLVTMSNKLSDNQIMSSGVTSDLQNTNERLKDKLKLFHSKIVKLAADVKVLQQQKGLILEDFKNYVEQVKLWQAQLKEFSSLVLAEHERENFKMKDECESLKLQMETLKKENFTMKAHSTITNELTERLETLTREIEEAQVLKEQLDELKNQNRILTENHQKTHDKFTTSIKQLEQYQMEIDRLTSDNQVIKIQNVETIQNLQKENETLKGNELKLTEQSANEIQEVNKKLAETKSALEARMDQQELLTITKRENVELLAEMNEMNQVLKERGETISKQQEYCEELLRNIKIYEAQTNKLSESLRQKEEIISKVENDLILLKDRSESVSDGSINEMHSTILKKEDEIKQLQNELSAIKEKIGLDSSSSQDVNYAESENMSTSTISRTDEMNRIKDLEGSWEERYGKLRSLALKLKGKIRDLTMDLTKEQGEKSDVQHRLANSVKTIQTLQAQCDKHQDQLEQSKLELKDFLKKLDNAALDISNSKKMLANNDEVITKLKSDIEGLNKEKINTENWKKQVSCKVQNLRKEVEANNVQKKEFEIQITKLNAQLESKEKQLKEETEKYIATRNSLQESNNECKKQSVLNLEMQDYERSLKDLTAKLEKKQELITKLKNQIDSQKSNVNSTKEQNRLLEERLQNDDIDLNAARNEIKAYKKTIGDLEMLILQKDNKTHDLTRSLESCRCENEEYATQLSKIAVEHQKTHDAVKAEKDYLRRQNLGLEQRLRETQDGLKICQDELKTLSDEYQGYKVRAQSVLRQNQTRDVGLEEKIQEEAATLKAQVDVLNSEVNDLKIIINTVTDDNAKLKSEKHEMESNAQLIARDLQDCRNQLVEFSKMHHKTLTEHAETIRGLKIHAETLGQCYRHQLSEQEVRHNREVIELQSKAAEKPPIVVEVPPLSPPTVPREQGEGSESDHFVNTRSIPLDRLLSSDSDQDIGFVRKQLSENETKVAHLTALLADTEQDLVKHVQMNKLLKEEIRRQQRSVEREKHAENLEYLKNVVFKFATLTSGDERSRLVPVLNTILKFSPEETNKLNMVARSDLGNRGWSDYLPIWSSGKPQ